MKVCTICGKSPVIGWGFCKKHYRAYDKYGDPNYSANLRGVPFEDRTKVDEITGCLLWVGGLTTSGYGCMIEGIERVAHRVSYRRYIGSIPPGMNVLHTCDRPQCVAPEHLFLGTHVENMLDMKLKGRAYAGKGETNMAAKLTERQAIAIMQDHRKQKLIADEYGVCKGMVDSIQNGRSWKHVFDARYREARLAVRPCVFLNISEIEKDTRTQMQIATEYGVSQSTISKIKRGVYDKNK